MYQCKNSNLLLIACPLVFLAAVYVPTPVQSQHPYELVSAIVDRENPNDGRDVFTLDIYTRIEFGYVDDGISQVWASKRDGTEKTARFPSVDYHTMILDVVIFDTGDPDRIVKCQFKNEGDAREFFRLFRHTMHIFQPNKSDVLLKSVLQYDYSRAASGNYHHVSAEGRISIEILTRSSKKRPSSRRFVIVGEDRSINMVFTSKTFNTAYMRNEYVVMRILTKYFSSDILIQCVDKDFAMRFTAYVYNNCDVDRRMPVETTQADLKLIFGDRFT